MGGIITKELTDLWVIKDCSITICGNEDSLDLDNELLGALVGALSGFVQGSFHETLFRFTTDKAQYCIIETFSISFVGKFPRYTGEGKIRKEMEIVKNKFFEIYSKEEIRNWDHNIKKFKDFYKIILGNKLDSLWRVVAKSETTI